MSCVCGHLKALHLAGVCRINGCGCEGFETADAPRPVTGQPRTVTIELPDGYMLSVSLVPYVTSEPVAAESAAEEGAA